MIKQKNNRVDGFMKTYTPYEHAFGMGIQFFLVETAMCLMACETPECNVCFKILN